MEGCGHRDPRRLRAQGPRPCPRVARRPGMNDPGFTWRVVVGPVRGTVSPAEFAEGRRLPAGSPLGLIRSRREEVNVSAGYDGVLAEWLVHEGDLVDAGDPIARLYPEVSE